MKPERSVSVPALNQNHRTKTKKNEVSHPCCYFNTSFVNHLWQAIGTEERWRFLIRTSLAAENRGQDDQYQENIAELCPVKIS